MGKKRKRTVKDDGATDSPPKCPGAATHCFRNKTSSSSEAFEHSHPVISLYYNRVVTLRQYLLQQLPVSSKLRRRRIASLGRQGQRSVKAIDDNQVGSVDQPQGIYQVANLLDTTLIGVLNESDPTLSQVRKREFAAYTQSQPNSSVNSSDSGPTSAQAEIVDFVISALFKRTCFSSHKPQHLLAHGYQRSTVGAAQEQGPFASSIPGLTLQYPNKNVLTLKHAPWTDILDLLGSNGEEIMVQLLLDCGIFTCIDERKGVYYQISGVPLSVLEPLDRKQPKPEHITSEESIASKGASASMLAKGKPNCNGISNERKEVLHKPNSIVLVRRRMLYARPALNAKGEVRFGLRHIHVLNRYPSSKSLEQTVHVMKYIFPRQFGLHNVFTSEVDRRETVQPFKDYVFREDEIKRIAEQKQAQIRRPGPLTDVENEQPPIKIPKRLRGQAVELVQKLQSRNERCAYTELLNHYCPPGATGPWKFDSVESKSQLNTSSSEPSSFNSEALVTQPKASNQQSLYPSESMPDSVEETIKQTIPEPKVGLTDYATPSAFVSAFCRAVLQKVIPPQFYGIGREGVENRRTVLRHVDRFIRMRRFESLSLHEVCKGIKITCIPWLEPPNIKGQSASPTSRWKLSLSDLQKRTELLHEFIYYIFDSLLIPLIRTNFYVTESQLHRNRLFYFRHDVWRRLIERPLADLKSSMFEELKPGKARRVLGDRSLGHSTLRLLPKTTGVRPILNLRRRELKKSAWGGKRGFFLAPSINSTVTPIYNMLSYERTRVPITMGSAMHSVGDIHLRLKQFKQTLLQQHAESRSEQQPTVPLYFAKLDIQSCFDTIPQHKLLRLIEELVSEEAYHVTKHVEIRPPGGFNSSWSFSGPQKGNPIRKFVGRAAPVTKPIHLPDVIASGTTARKTNTVFVDTLAQKEYTTDYLLGLLDEHVRNNLVKIGKKYFRQRNGIPQGSVLSSLLCNFFYAELEREVLGFLKSKDALLFRLIDDFLLITSDSSLATRFLKVMVKGQPAYGISVNPAKSLVNFKATVEGTKIPRLVGSSFFPYCGNLIHTRTLEVHKDQERILEGGDSVAGTLSDALTVESTRIPGRTFHRKVLASFKLHMHPMYLDTAHNTPQVVLTNLYASFVTAAMRTYRYMKSLRGSAHPAPQVIIRTIRDLINLVHGLIQTKREVPKSSSRESEQPTESDLRFSCSVQRSQVQYLAAAAFRFVLGRKQTRYGTVLRWLDLVSKAARPSSDGEAVRIWKVVRNGNATFEGWRF